MLIVLLALFASACGGSDGAGSGDDAVSQVADDEDGVNSDDADASDSAEDTVVPPPPLALEISQERDCVHTNTELKGEAGDEAAGDAPLPPAEKPEVGDEYFGDFDELIVTDLIEGSGREAVAGSAVDMQYVGVLATDGTQFDASWDRGGAPFSFTLGTGGVIQGWDDGIEGMKVGGRRVLQIPSALAYGEQDRSEIIVANSDLIFIVDLVSVSAPPEAAPPVPADSLGEVGSLTVVDLVEGQGCTAEIGDIVAVNYVGVDAVDGIEFDSSWGRGDTFQLIVGRSQVIDGWNEGIAGMKVGGERILRIPSDQAYNEGDLVFRVHLEELVEAPAAHQVTFDGDAPGELEITSLTEGTGDGAELGDTVDSNIVVTLHNSGTILQSSWQQGSPAQLVLQEGTMIPGLEEGMTGVKVGELRQISIPTEVAYPDGIPPNSGIEPGDALVFIIEPLRITKG